MFSTRKRCLIGIPIWGYQKFYSLPPKNWILGKIAVSLKTKTKIKSKAKIKAEMEKKTTNTITKTKTKCKFNWWNWAALNFRQVWSFLDANLENQGLFKWLLSSNPPPCIPLPKKTHQLQNIPQSKAMTLFDPFQNITYRYCMVWRECYLQKIMVCNLRWFAQARDCTTVLAALQ